MRRGFARKAPALSARLAARLQMRVRDSRTGKREGGGGHQRDSEGAVVVSITSSHAR
jgi:hypothetical protein